MKGDKKQAFIYKLFIAAFFAMLILPYPLFWVFGRFFDNASRENRSLATMPTLASPIETIPSAIEDYINDHAAFREVQMRLNAGINYNLFGVVSSENTLLGKDEWLFYKNVSDSRSLDDYQGINAFSDAELRKIADNLIRLQANLKRSGTKLAILMPPNKENVYAQYMPDCIPKVSPQTKADKLVSYLQNNTNIPIAYPKSALIDACATYDTYYKLDTHWNTVGAYIGYKELCDELHLRAAALCDVIIKQDGITAYWQDLAAASSTYNIFPQQPFYTVEGYTDNISAVQNTLLSNENIDVYTSDAQNDSKILMLRDSFGTAIMPYIANTFKDSIFVHINAFDENTIQNAKPDIFVLELVERNCDRFTDYLPRLVEWTD